MVQKKRDVPQKSEMPKDLQPTNDDVPAETPPPVEATGSTDETKGREALVEAEAGGEGVADVVAKETDDGDLTDERRRDEPNTRGREASEAA